MSNDAIAALSYWRGKIEIEPLTGGITNHNFLVEGGGEKFVVRQCEDCGHLGIDRPNELRCQRAAYAAGVSPELVHVEGNMLVTRFIEGSTLQPEAIDSAMIQRLAATLRQLHESREELTGEMLYFCPFQTVRTYAETTRRIAAELPADIDTLLNESRELSRTMPAFHPTLCHNDLLPGNILDDGNRLWLIDWEYAGIGNPVFDLAGLTANCQLTPDQTEELTHAYAGKTAPETQQQIENLKAVSLLREALWAVIQTVKSKVEFDYAQYAAENFAAYRKM